MEGVVVVVDDDDGGDGGWRAQLAVEARQRIVARISENMKKSVQADLTDGLIDLQRVAARLESRAYFVARNLSEYLRRISLRMLSFESESPFLLVPRPPQLALPSHELNHRLELHRKDFKGLLAMTSNHQSQCSTEKITVPIIHADGLLDRDPPGCRMKLCAYDRLSDLPDTMLHHIMSFLSAQEVARTSVLSQRWRLLWTSAPCLDISVDQFGNDRRRFSKFIEQFLQLRGPASLDTFRLHSSAVDGACNWIDHAIKHNVRVLEFTERWEPFYLEPQHIALTSRFLKCLILTNVALNAEVFDPLNHACPALENLQLIRSFLEVPVISSNSLKKLDIINCSLSKALVIQTPNLISLLFASPHCESSLLKSLFITRAMVTLFALSNAKNIELTVSVKEVRFARETPRCVMFDSLRNLSLGSWCLCDNFFPLVCFLRHSPLLEYLTLKVDSNDGKEMDTVCLRERRSFSSDHLKKVTIFCRKDDARVAVLATMLRANQSSLAEIDIKYY
ncbi:hypothetical protein ACP70R_022287 [Stipagrostis hirtigluma subsp. patula]